MRRFSFRPALTLKGRKFKGPRGWAGKPLHPPLTDFPIAAYSVKNSGGGKYFEIVGEQVEAGPYGIAVAKGNDELRDALQAAVQALIDNGEYKKIIEKWGVEDGAITEAKINGGS